MWYQLYSWWAVLDLIEVPSYTRGELCSILIEVPSYARGELGSIWSGFPVILVVSCAQFDQGSQLYLWWAVKREGDKTNDTYVF